MKFKNKVVMVTGGTRGIGKGIVHSFLKEGAVVIATYVGNTERAMLSKVDFKEFGDNYIIYQCDVRNEPEVIELYKMLEEKYLKLDVLVNNSGIRKDQLTATMSISDWNDVINTNLTGTFIMSKHAVLLMMKKRFGRIINMSSVGGEIGLPGQANYAASKAGQVAISQTLSKEVAKRGITVNNVLPGFIDTELISDLPKELKDEYLKTVPMKRFGNVNEVAAAVLFFASDEASYITGASLCGWRSLRWKFFLALQKLKN
jgi:3-oxoacyl-[acyl-carrier protein] reductase